MEMIVIQRTSQFRFDNSHAPALHGEDKRLINCRTVDVNQLMPLKYHWAWEHYINGCANHWMPTEVAMATDIATWKNGSLSDAERQFLSRSAVRVLQKGEYRLADVAALVLRAASGARVGDAAMPESLEPA